MISFKRHLLAMGSAIALMASAAPAFAYTNTAYISQPGSYNTAYQYQGGGNGNLAITNQYGNYGSASQIQNGNNNYANINQSGLANIASQTQIGTGNAAFIIQGGSYQSRISARSLIAFCLPTALSRERSQAIRLGANSRTPVSFLLVGRPQWRVCNLCDADQGCQAVPSRPA